MSTRITIRRRTGRTLAARPFFILVLSATVVASASLVPTPRTAGGAAQQNSNRPAVRIVRPSPTATPTPSPSPQSNTNRTPIRIGPGPRRTGNTNANANANTSTNSNAGATANANANARSNANSRVPLERRDPTGPVNRREANANRGLIRIGNSNAAANTNAPSNSNRGLIRIGNTNGNSSPNANRSSNANRDAGRRDGGFVIGGGGRTSSPDNANTSGRDREGATGGVGPRAGGAELAGPTRLFSMRVESELVKMGRAVPVKRASFAVPQRLAGFPAVTLMNDSRAAGVFQCVGGDKAAEEVTVEDAGSYVLVTFQCRRPGTRPTKGAATDKFSVAFRKEEAGKLFQQQQGRGPGLARTNTVMSRGGARRVPAGMTRDDFELSNCLSEFGKYKSDPRTNHFRVFFLVRAYRCEARRSATSDVLRAQWETASKFSKAGPKPTASGAPWDLSARIVTPKEIYDPDFKGKKEYDTNYLKTATVQSGVQGEQEFRFLTAAKDPEMQVAVQLADSPAKHVVGPSGACEGWDASEEIVRQRVVTPTYAAPPPNSPPSPDGKRQAKQAVSVSVPLSFLWDGLPAKPNVPVHVRVVPVLPSGKSIIKGATKYRCMGGPSQWVRIDVTNVSAAVQNYIAEEAARAAAYKKAKDEVLGQNPTPKSPIRVQLLSYLPRTDHYALPPEATAYQLLAEEPVNKNYLNCNKKVGGLCTFHIGAPDADFGWPDPIWTRGCAFAPADLLDGFKYSKDPETFFEYLALALDFVAKVYDQIQQGIVDAVTVWVTLGQCAPGDNAGACGWVRGAMRVGLSIAMAAAGLPPHIPTIAQLSDQGAEFIAATAVDYTISQIPSAGEFADQLLSIPKEQLRQELIAGAKKGLQELTGLGKCAFPIEPGKSWQETGYDGVDPRTGCGVVNGNPFSLGTKNLALAERPAVVYLRVTRNAGGIQLSESQTLSVADAENFFEPKAVRVNLADVPSGPEGLVVPVFLTPNFKRYAGQSWPGGRKIGDCGPGCTIDYEFDAAWLADMHAAATKVTFRVSAPFRWLDDAKLHEGFGCKGCSPLAGAEWVEPTIPLGKIKGEYGWLKLPQPCPGFKYVSNSHAEPLGVFPVYY